MAGIIDQLPKTSQLEKLEKLVDFKPKLMGFEKPKLDELPTKLRTLPAGDPLKGLSLPRPPSQLSKDGFLRSLNQPLDRLKSFDGKKVLGDLNKAPLPINKLPTPQFDLNRPIKAINAKLIPGAGTVSAPTVNIPGLDFSGALDPLSHLARAGASRPLRLLHMLMRVVDALAATLSDADKLFELSVQSLSEIYCQQIEELQACLPVYTLHQSMRTLGEADTRTAFSIRYRLLLDQIDGLGPNDTEQLKLVLATGRNELIPALQAFNRYRVTLDALYQNDTTLLLKKLVNALDMTGMGEVLLQASFDQAAEHAHGILAAIVSPVNEIGDMTGPIVDYLKHVAEQGKLTAKTLSEQIGDNLRELADSSEKVIININDIERLIQAYTEKFNIGPLVEKAKMGCRDIGDAVEQFFAQVEALKLKLDEMVKKLEKDTDQQLTEALNAAAARLNELLRQITGVLERGEVKDAFNQARLGIEQFKTSIAQASLKPVFDLVIDNTGRLEQKIKGLDVSRLSTPQKAALKVGSKVIEQVQVDEIVKPELLDAFAQIRAPLAELIAQLKHQAVEIENLIYAFEPGKVVNEYIVTAEPFRELLSLLDEFQPSKLLAPLKQANESLTDVVHRLDPNLLIDEVKQISNQFDGLLDVINPAKLNQLISDASEVAVSRLGRLRDQELDGVIDDAKNNISLPRLLEGSGLEDIANVEFWTLLQNILGGRYLNEVDQAFNSVERQLERQAATLEFGRPQTSLAETLKTIDRQLAVSAPFIAEQAKSLDIRLAIDSETLRQLEERRKALLKKSQAFPEISVLLDGLELSPLLQLQTVNTGIVSMDAVSLGKSMEKLKEVLRPSVDPLRKLGGKTFQDAASLIFRQQLSEPIADLIAKVKADLKPFPDALKNINGVTNSIAELPATIETDVATVLDAAHDGIRQVISESVNTLTAFQQSLPDTLNLAYAQVKGEIDELSPYWLLNVFLETDFAVENGIPVGMLSIARHIVSGSDAAGLRVAALLQAKLTASQFELLKSESKDSATSLHEGNRNNVLLAVNQGLRDRGLCSRENVDALKAALDRQLRELQGNPSPIPADFTQIYRLSALCRQLADAWVNYTGGIEKSDAMIRLNRLILEAAYPNDIEMSLQSLQPFVAETVAQLYPLATVQSLDAAYGKLAEKIKGLPDQLIRAPLDDEFGKIKRIMQQNFDIAGLFAVLEIKLNGMDGELAQGLERLSIAYDNLLQTFDRRMAA